jgi:hypothetical protein
MRALASEYDIAAREHSQEPDMELLSPVLAVFQKLNASPGEPNDTAE